MKHAPFLKPLGLLGVALFLFQFSLAHAAQLTPSTEANSDTDQAAFDNFSPNLLTGLTPSGPAPDYVSGFDFALSGVNDGAADGSPGANDVYYDGSAPFSSGHTLTSDPAITFTFATPVSIGSIETIYGWQDNQSFSDQDYTITYTVGNDPTELTLGNVAYNPFDPAFDESGGPEDASEVILSNLALTDVSSLTFQLAPYDSPTNDKEQGAALIREFEAFPIPEPSTWALLGAGLAFLGFRLRRKTA